MYISRMEINTAVNVVYIAYYLSSTAYYVSSITREDYYNSEPVKIARFIYKLF